MKLETFQESLKILCYEFLTNSIDKTNTKHSHSRHVHVTCTTTEEPKLGNYELGSRNGKQYDEK